MTTASRLRAARIERFGGPEVIRVVEDVVSAPRPGHVLVHVMSAGLNFIDIYHRTGAYPNQLPFTLGVEGAGVVLAVGDGVRLVRPGARVAWILAPGAYATHAVVPEERVIPLPPSMPFDQAAALFLQGMTAHFLTSDVFALRSGDSCLVHAAGGATGQLLCRMAKLRGARVIGTASGKEKIALAEHAGADAVIDYSSADFVAEVRQLTFGRGVDVAYDGVGRATFLQTLECVRRRGMVVLFGQASGPVEPLDPQILNAKGSLFLTRPLLHHYVATREEYLTRADDLIRWWEAGIVRPTIHGVFSLEQAAAAQAELEGRRTTGKVLLRLSDPRDDTSVAGRRA